MNKRAPSNLAPVEGPVAAGVLCGGASRRFGSDKAVAVAGDRLMGTRVIDACRAAGCDPVVALGGNFGAELGVPVIADNEPGGGPLQALHGALRWLGRGWLLVVPCDLPLLHAAHLTPLIAARSPQSATIAMVEGRPQPSLGLWPASFAGSLHRSLHQGKRSFTAGLEAGPWHGIQVPAVALSDADDPATLDHLLAQEGCRSGT